MLPLRTSNPRRSTSRPESTARNESGKSSPTTPTNRTGTYCEAESAKFIWRPQTTIPVTGDAVATLVKLLGILDDLDDVQSVYANYDIPAEWIAEFAGS